MGLIRKRISFKMLQGLHRSAVCGLDQDTTIDQDSFASMKAAAKDARDPNAIMGSQAGRVLSVNEQSLNSVPHRSRAPAGSDH